MRKRKIEMGYMNYNVLKVLKNKQKLVYLQSISFNSQTLYT